MKKIVLYPNRDSDDNVSYEFGEGGKLVAFRIDKDMNEQQFNNFRKLLPFNHDAFKEMIDQWQKNNIKFKMEEVPLDISFERFYNAYAFHGGEKRNRIRANKEWDKLTEADKAGAINYVKKYAVSCKNRGTGMKHPDTYLSNRTWND